MQFHCSRPCVKLYTFNRQLLWWILEIGGTFRSFGKCPVVCLVLQWFLCESVNWWVKWLNRLALRSQVTSESVVRSSQNGFTGRDTNKACGIGPGTVWRLVYGPPGSPGHSPDRLGSEYENSPCICMCFFVPSRWDEERKGSLPSTSSLCISTILWRYCGHGRLDYYIKWWIKWWSSWILHNWRKTPSIEIIVGHKHCGAFEKLNVIKSQPAVCEKKAVLLVLLLLLMMTIWWHSLRVG